MPDAHTPASATSPRHPRLVVFSSLAFAVIGALLAVLFLTYDPGRNALLGGEHDFNKRYLAYVDEFGENEPLLVVFGAPQEQATLLYARRLAAAVRDEPRMFRGVALDFPPPGVESLAQLAPEALAHTLRWLKPLTRLAEREPPITWSAVLETFGAAVARGEATWSDYEALLRRAEAGTPVDPPEFWAWATGAPPPGAHARQVGLLVVRLHPTDAPGAPDESAAAARLHELIAATPGRIAAAGMTGGVALKDAEVRGMTRDTTRASVVALFGVCLVIFAFYHSLRLPLAIVISLFLALGWAFGLVTLIVGQLNLLSGVFAVILMGLGADFGVHFTMAYRHRRRGGEAIGPALAGAQQETWRGILFAGLTTIAAFLMVGFADFRGIAELGYTAALGIACGVLSARVALPALIVLLARKRPKKTRRLAPPRTKRRSWWRFAAQFAARHTRALSLTLVVLGAITIGLGLWRLPQVRFDTDMLSLQDPGLAPVVYQRALLDDPARASLFGVSIAPDREAARTRAAALEALPRVAKVRWLESLIPAGGAERQALVKRLWGAPAIRTDLTPPADRDITWAWRVTSDLPLMEALDRALLPAELPPGVRDVLARWRARLGRGALRNRLEANALGRAWERLLRAELATADHVLSDMPTSADTLPAWAREHYVSAAGRYLLEVLPRDDLWQTAARDDFLTEVRRIDPALTGVPVQFTESLRLMRDGFQTAGFLALIAAVVLVLIDFRQVVHAALALAPLVTALLALLALMPVFGLTLNPANIVIVPAFVGIAIDDGIYFVHRLRGAPDQSPWQIARSSTGLAVTVTSLTTMAAFGALLSVGHRGIYSLGAMFVLGVGTALVATVALVPALLSLLPERLWRVRPPPPEPTASAAAGEQVRA